MAGHIYITGDTHGWEQIGSRCTDGLFPRLNSNNFPEQKQLDKDDYVVICGDFGGVWHFDKRYVPLPYQYLHDVGNESPLPHGESHMEKSGLDWLENKSFTTLFIGGNHENYSRLYGAYPIIDYKGGKAVKIRDHVLMLMSGYVFNIAGKKLFAFGGARSHDIRDGVIDPADAKYHQNWRELSTEVKRFSEAGKMFRVKEVSWWDQEMPNKAMMDRGIDNLDNNNWKVDYILTHCCPTNLLNHFSYGAFSADALTDYLQSVEKLTTYKYWFFGHYHNTETFHIKNQNSTEVMLYEQIVDVPLYGTVNCSSRRK